MSSPRWLTVITTLLVGLGFLGGALQAADSGAMHLEAILVWATNNEKPADPKLKELDAGLIQKLRKSPYKWANYYQVHTTNFVASSGVITNVALSTQCYLGIKNLGEKDRVEVNLVGRGKPVSRRVEALSRGELMITGGDDKNDTAWFIVLRQFPRP
jgi:hypothetical protein